MKKMSVFPLLATIVLAYPALAADLPVYPIDGRCQAHWPGDAKMQKVCIRQQQASYDALKPLWISVPAEIAQHCQDEWEKSKDYVILQFCVEQQVLALKKAAVPTPN